MKTTAKNQEKEKATWQPHDSSKHGPLSTTKKNVLPGTTFAFPHARKEPITDAAHVRNAMARFNQVEGVTDAEKDLAFANIQKAAKHFGMHITEKNWREFGTKH